MLSPLPAPEGQPPESGVAAYTEYLVRSAAPYADITVLAQKRAAPSSLGPATSARVWSPSLIIPFQVRTAVSRVRPDIFHVQHEFNLYGGLVQGELLTILMLSLRRRGIRTVTTVHGVVAPEDVTPEFLERNALPRSQALVRRAFYAAYRSIDASSDLLIVHHEYFRSVLVGPYGAPSRKVFVIPPGVAGGNESVHPLRKRSAQNILALGFLTGYKAPEVLVEVAESTALPGATFTFCVGANPRITDRKYQVRYADLERRVRALGPRAKWEGYIPDEALASTFEEADVLVLPYTECVSVSAVAALAFRSRTRICHSRPLRPLFGVSPYEFELNSVALTEALVHALSSDADSSDFGSASWDDAAQATLGAWSHMLTLR